MQHNAHIALGPQKIPHGPFGKVEALVQGLPLKTERLLELAKTQGRFPENPFDPGIHQVVSFIALKLVFHLEPQILGQLPPETQTGPADVEPVVPTL